MLGINSVPRLVDADIVPEAEGVLLDLSSGARWGLVQAKERYHAWVLASGFRELVEAVHELLDEVHGVFCLWDVHVEQRETGKMTVPRFDELVADARARFHRFGLPDKFKHLRESHDFLLPDDWTEALLALNGARNCFVHRRGHVTYLDVGESGAALVVCWKRMALMERTSAGKQEVTLPAYVPAGAEIGLEETGGERRFAVGSDLAFTRAELVEICWTVFRFGALAAAETERCGRALGIAFTDLPQSGGDGLTSRP